MDAAGKDGTIRHVMSGVNPQGVEVRSFKTPSSEDLDHDYLWRYQRRLPQRGHIGIFNRSYYEEVLIVRVHREILSAENLPEELVDDKTIWKDRYQSIVELEKHLHRNGTKIVKFFLHISKKEQRERFLKRIEDPEKNWKFSRTDIEERKHWDDYMKAYEDCLNATSTDHAPWYVVPADNKLNARLLVPLTRGQNGASLQFEVEVPSLDEFEQFRERGLGSSDATGNWMHAFSEVLTSPPEVELLRIA